MNPALVLQHLDAWVLSVDDAGGLVSDDAPPRWAAHFDLPGLAEGGDETPLGSFIADVRAHWADGGASAMQSEIWWEVIDASERAFRAEAFRADGESMLIIQRLGQDFHRQHEILQLARQQTLGAEALEAEVSRRTAQIRERETEIASRLISAACARDEETGAHIRRIGLYSEALAELLRWSRRDSEDLRGAAPMHDLGKIAIPDSILRKPGPLTNAERQIMMTHPTLGAQILEDSDIPMIRMAADVARCHHERFDGTGYPAGLIGDAIPVSARIVAIADVYDAMTHARVYKPAFSEAQSLEKMRSMEGHFDPDLLTLFIDNVDRMRAIRLQNPDDAPNDYDSAASLAYLSLLR